MNTDFLRNAIKGGDFDTEVCDGLLELIEYTERLQDAARRAMNTLIVIEKLTPSAQILGSINELMYALMGPEK